MNPSKQSGFTLIEIIMILLIIGVLASVAATRYINLTRNTTDGVARSVLGALRSQSALIYAKNIAGGTTASYTMGIVATSMWRTTSTTRGLGFTMRAYTNTIRITVNGNVYTFTFTPYPPRAPTTFSRITAGGGTYAAW